MSNPLSTTSKRALRIWLLDNDLQMSTMARKLGYEPGTLIQVALRYLGTDLRASRPDYDPDPGGSRGDPERTGQVRARPDRG